MLVAILSLNDVLDFKKKIFRPSESLFYPTTKSFPNTRSNLVIFLRGTWNLWVTQYLFHFWILFLKALYGKTFVSSFGPLFCKAQHCASLGSRSQFHTDWLIAIDLPDRETP